MVGRTALALTIMGCCACAACSHGHAIDSSPEPVLEFSGTIDLPGPGEVVWGENCLIHRPCEAIKPLSACPRDMKLATFPLPIATGDDGERVMSIAGRLLQDEAIESTLVGCPSGSCCNAQSKAAFLAVEEKWGFSLPSFGCFGDESRLCCNVIAIGQQVVATGRVRVEGQGAMQRVFFKDAVSLCHL